MFVVATTNLSFYCSHFGWPEIWHVDVSWPLQGWYNLGHHLLIFLILASFWLVKQGKFAIPDIVWRTKWRNELWHADVFWPPSELIKFWSWSVDFPFLVSFWLSETGQIWGLWQFSSECMGGMACNCNMLMYPDYLLNCVHFGHGLSYLQFSGIFLVIK